jgi:hypothetical protein
MARKTLKEMVNLTTKNNPYSQSFPDELLIAIFWEETTFQNIEQIKGKKGEVGLGFGQVQENVLPLIKVRLHKAFPRGLITQDDNMSVEVASYALETIRQGLKMGSAEAAYKQGYAGATKEGKNEVMPDGRTRGQLANDVWQASLALKARKSWDDKETVKAALRKARTASDAVFDTVLS